MVAKKKAALNKSAEIRKALAQYPDKGPAAIAKLLSQQHGVPFRAKAVTSIKTKQGQQPASGRSPVASSAAQQTPTQRPVARSASSAARDSVAVMVTNLQAYIQRHGKQDLHRLIDTL
jgi:cell pole-organizing protein PopZ